MQFKELYTFLFVRTLPWKVSLATKSISKLNYTFYNTRMLDR